MIGLTAEDMNFKESTEFPGLSTNIMSAASQLENREFGHFQDPRLVNLGTIDFLTFFCGSLYPTKPMDEYRKDLLNYLSPYVFKRVVEFEHEKRTGMDIADWMRRIAKKIELWPTDIKIKESLNDATKKQVEWAAQALEHTNRQQSYQIFGDIRGEKRSAVGVLLDFMIVDGKRYDGGIAALAETPDEALKKAREIGLSPEKDQQNESIARQQLDKHLPRIVGHIRYLYDLEHYSFKEVAQWLRLFLTD